MEKKLTAEYQLVPAEKGSCYRFFCAVTGAALCTQEAYRAEDPEQELLLAWEREGRGQFNQCRKMRQMGLRRCLQSRGAGVHCMCSLRVRGRVL